MVCQTVRDKATQSVGQEVDVFQGVSCGPAEAKESMGSPVRIVDVRWINARLGQVLFHFLKRLLGRCGKRHDGELQKALLGSRPNGIKRGGALFKGSEMIWMVLQPKQISPGRVSNGRR